MYFLKSIEFSTKLPNFMNIWSFFKKIQGFDPLLTNRGTKMFQATWFLNPRISLRISACENYQVTEYFLCVFLEKHWIFYKTTKFYEYIIIFTKNTGFWPSTDQQRDKFFSSHKVPKPTHFQATWFLNPRIFLRISACENCQVTEYFLCIFLEKYWIFCKTTTFYEYDHF